MIPIKEEIDTLRAGQPGPGPLEIVSTRLLQSDAPAGAYVFPSDDGECDLPAQASDVTDDTGGFLLLASDRVANANGLEWASGDRTRYVREGYITVITEGAVSDTDPVYVRHTANGGNTQLGACAGAAGTGLSLLPNARFVHDSPSGKALVRRK